MDESCKPIMDGNGWKLFSSGTPLSQPSHDVGSNRTDLGPIGLIVCKVARNQTLKIGLSLPIVAPVIPIGKVAVMVQELERQRLAFRPIIAGGSPARGFLGSV